jgi:alpha-tubulin suppressor-like RCC1 family protein
MRSTDKPLKVLVSGLCVVWLGLTGRQAAQTPSMTVAPASSVISVGQARQFTTSGAVIPTGVSAGGEYTCIRLSDGTAQCAGRNQFGQLADSTWADSTTLVTASGLTTATHVAAGDEFGCAVLADGTGRCWGLGEKGQRGDGTRDQVSLAPVAVSGLTNAVSLTAGYNHACALSAGGTMACWGGNADGQLGDPASVPAGSPVPATVRGINGAVAIAAGAFHTCALLADGTLRCWGQNGQGQLGDGTLDSSSAPVTVAITGVAGVSGGGHHTCAVLVDGTVQCWGNNYEGELGDGTTEPSPTPVHVVGITSAVAISAGWAHTCARLQDGAVQCWGDNAFGQLGNGTATNTSTPVPVRGVSGALAISSGWWHHSCAVFGDGSVRCWGVNEWGQFGNGTTANSSVPATMSGTGVTWTSSSSTVATIDATGLATAVSAGTTTITATDSTGASASATLTVRDPVMLSVIPSGSGSGSVNSTPPGISCGTDCSEPYRIATSVTLTASPSSRSTFEGWSGCDTASGTACTVTMNDPRAVTAAFELKRFVLTINRSGLFAGSGNVSSSPAGISCGTDCSEPYTVDTVVTLTATPSLLFTGWSGCDAVSGATCTVTMRAAASVTASFLGLP